MKHQTDNVTELKTLRPDRPAVLHLFLFWLIVFVLPAISSKLLLNAYVIDQNSEIELRNRDELRQEMELFIADIDVANRLKEDIALVERLLPDEISNTANTTTAELCVFIRQLLEKNALYQPFLIAVYDPERHATEVIRSADSIINPGNKSMAIMLSYLKENGTDAVTEGKTKLYLQICRSIFGDFLKPAQQPGVIESGFITKENGEKLFIYYNYLKKISATGQKPVMMLIFTESSTDLQRLVKHAGQHPANPMIKRSYGLLRTIANRDYYTDRQNRLHYAVPLAPELLRTGSHTGKDWYTKAIKSRLALKVPARIPYAIVTHQQPTEAGKGLTLILLNLALLGIVFSGITLIKQVIGNHSAKSSINRKLTLSILLSTTLPFVAMTITAHKFIESYNQTIIHNRLRNMSNDLYTLEANMHSNDMHHKEKTAAFVDQLRANISGSESSLRRLLSIHHEKLVAGYIFFRSDGLLLEKLPSDSEMSSEDHSKLMVMRDVTLAQFYDILAHTNSLHPSFDENVAKIPGFKNWRAISGHFIDNDRDSLCLQSGDYFPIKISDRPYVTFSTHNLFPEKTAESLSGFVMLLTDSSKFAEMYIAGLPGSSFALYEGGSITHNAVFRLQNNYHVDKSLAWPVSALKDNYMLQTVGRLNANVSETAWYSFDKDGIATLIAARKLSDLPFALACRTELTETAITGTILPILILLAIMYLLALIKLLSAMLSDVFTRPVGMLMEGLELLDGRNYPVIADSSNNELGRLISYFNNMVEGMRHRKILERFISEEVSETIASSDSQDFAGRQVYRVIMFIHIRKFDELCESLKPEAVINLLNLYFSTLEQAIVTHGGQIDKYIADAIMISFADERTNSQPEAAALITANECMKKLPELNEKLAANGLPTIKTGIGIAAGPVISGQIGAYRGRKDFTLIGDAVNLAARLESISHFDNNPHVLVSKAVEQKTAGHFKFYYRDTIKVKGKDEPVEVFELPQTTNE